LAKRVEVVCPRDRGKTVYQLNSTPAPSVVKIFMGGHDR
jgi:hypothetical protein